MFNEQRIACIWLPNWSIQRLRAGRPGLTEIPLVLHRPGRGRRSCVTACSAAANRLGIAVGMPLVEARSLVRICEARSQGAAGASLTAPLFVNHDTEADRAALIEIARDCHRFAPRVGIEDTDAPESLLLDVTGVTDWWGGEDSLQEEIRRELVRRGLGFRAAFADTIGLAWAVAHFGCEEATCDGRFTDNGQHATWGWECAPDGPASDVQRVPVRVGAVAMGTVQTLVGTSHAITGHEKKSRQAWETLIRSLPIGALRLPDEMVELFERLGVRQIGQLVRLPRSELQSRFGPRLLQRIDQAAGTMEELLIDLPARETPAAEMTLEFPTDRYERIDLLIGRLIERVLETFVVPSHGVLELVCRFECQDARTVMTTVSLFQPSRSVDHLQELVRLQQPWHRWGGGVTRLRVLVTRSARFDYYQKRLFDDDRPVTDSRQFSTLIDRLTGRLNRSAVVRVQPLPDVQPERAWAPVPLVACEETSRGKRTTTSSKTGQADAHGRRALRSKRSRSKRRSSQSALSKLTGGGRCRKDGDNQSGNECLSVAVGLHRPPFLLPVPIVVDPMVVAPDGTPRRFRWTSRWYDVARHWGPERIETAWWRTDPVRRDYYRVEVVTGHRFWLFRCLVDGRWFLQGME